MFRLPDKLFVIAAKLLYKPTFPSTGFNRAWLVVSLTICLNVMSVFGWFQLLILKVPHTSSSRYNILPILLGIMILFYARYLYKDRGARMNVDFSQKPTIKQRRVYWIYIILSVVIMISTAILTGEIERGEFRSHHNGKGALVFPRQVHLVVRSVPNLQMNIQLWDSCDLPMANHSTPKELSTFLLF